MKVFFLEAKQKLTKFFKLDGTSDPYPMAHKFNSHEILVETIQDFYHGIVKFGALGYCLLKGELAHPLVWESRAGSTDSEQPTDWFCLDLDGLTAYKDLDECLSALNLAQFDHIVQWSASSGFKPGLRCHVIFLLASPIHPAQLKVWFKSLNLTHLSGHLRLTRSKVTVQWLIDVSVGQNDKLLYISAPTLEAGLQDPHPAQSRYQLVIRTERFVPAPVVDPEKVRKEELALINKLRLAEGLPTTRTHTYAKAGNVEYLSNNKLTAQVTGVKVERGYVYLNLNGGDSWGYYHPEDNPRFLYNFKGEPVYETKTLLPEYHKQVCTDLQKKPDASGRVYLAFREFRTGRYWNGFYNPTNETVTLAPAKSSQQLADFMAQYQAPWSGTPTDWDITYLPADPIRVNFDTRTINTYEPAKHDFNTGITYTYPPLTRRVIDHVCGDPAIAQVFINWLAYIVQTKSRPSTAWLFHGTQGTGKGLLANYILPHLLGPSNVTLRRQTELEEQFNSYLEGKLIAVVDEVQFSSLSGSRKVNSSIKNWITEDTITIRKMHTDGYPIKNTCSLIFCSNMPDPITLGPEDRRIHTGAYQANKLVITHAEVSQLVQEAETFYGYLMQHKVDVQLARTPVLTAAKQQVVEDAMSGPETVADAIRKGNFGFFVEQLPFGKLQVPVSRDIALQNYRAALRSILERQVHVTRDELYALFVYTQGSNSVPDSPNKFTKFLSHLRMGLKTLKINGHSVRGFYLEHWNITDDDRMALNQRAA